MHHLTTMHLIIDLINSADLSLLAFQSLHLLTERLTAEVRFIVLMFERCAVPGGTVKN